MQCIHGERNYRTGSGARGPWAAHFCSLPKDTPGVCKPEWVDAAVEATPVVNTIGSAKPAQTKDMTITRLALAKSFIESNKELNKLELEKWLAWVLDQKVMEKPEQEEPKLEDIPF